MLSGYFKNPDLLKIYLIRNQQIAERDNFLSLVEFYDNCNITLENVKKQISELYNDRKKELYLILSDQKIKNKDTSYIQKEIDFLKPDNFQIPLFFITNQQFRGHLSYSDIEFIENTIRQIFVYVDSKEPYTIEYNEGKYYYDTSENKLYTGIDFYRKSYFRSDKIEFPYNCPDLILEYYEISLQKYKEDEKQKSSIMYNEIEVTKEFINLELTRNSILIEGLSDAINRVKNTAFKSKSKIQLVKYCKRYDTILNNKLDEINQPQQIKINKPNKIKKEIKSFIQNVNDKENFIIKLKELFLNEKGKQIKAMIIILERNELLLIPDRQFLSFYNSLQTEFYRDIGTYTSINDEKEKDFDEAYLSKFEKVLKPLITKYKTK